MADQADRPRPLLSVRGIEKHFGAVRALNGIDLDIPRGQVTALVGDNGAGKSVLIKCMAGIHEPDAGEIIWEGKPVRIRNPREAAALGIEVVYQDLALCDNLDVVENMFLGREVLTAGLLDEDSMERSASKILSDLRVTTLQSVREPVASLSGGDALARWEWTDTARGPSCLDLAPASIELGGDRLRAWLVVTARGGPVVVDRTVLRGR